MWLKYCLDNLLFFWSGRTLGAFSCAVRTSSTSCFRKRKSWNSFFRSRNGWKLNHRQIHDRRKCIFCYIKFAPIESMLIVLIFGFTRLELPKELDSHCSPSTLSILNEYFRFTPVRGAVHRAEQWEAGEPRGERQAEDDQRRAVPSAGEHEPGAGAGPGTAGHAAGAGHPAAPGERAVSKRITLKFVSTLV